MGHYSVSSLLDQEYLRSPNISGTFLQAVKCSLYKPSLLASFKSAPVTLRKKTALGRIGQHFISLVSLLFSRLRFVLNGGELLNLSLEENWGYLT